jgi:hypothetical protein
LNRRKEKLRRISDASARPPHPAPRLETLDQTPLGNGAGQAAYKSMIIGKSTVLWHEFVLRCANPSS